MAYNGKASPSLAASDGQRSVSGGGSRHSRMAEVQRARLLGAMVAEVAARGAANVSVAHVVARAGVSRRTFYELFEDREDCLLAAFDDALVRVTHSVREVDDAGARWTERIRTELIAILAFLDAEPHAAYLLIFGSMGAGPRALERRQRVLGQIAAVIDQGRHELEAEAQPPPLTAEGIVGGVLSILQARLIADAAPRPAQAKGARDGDDGGSLLELAGPLMGMIVLPYLGAGAARREARRPAPKAAAVRAVPRREDPLRDLDMRLTYRTMRVLTAVAERPGSSNRLLGEAAEIGDQGQVSKLLARLQRRGLIENGGEGAATRGEPNAWRLTTRGAEVHESIVHLES